jgi:hypothetical protein
VWAGFLALAAPLLAPSAATAQATPGQAPAAERVDDYLNNLGLGDLRVIHLEEVVGRDPSAQGPARTLADLYAARLLATTEAKEVEGLNARIDALIAKHPEANSPALRVMRLQGDYNRAEALASRWVEDPDDSASRDAAVALLARITPELDEQQAKLFAELDREREAVDELPEGPEKDRREQALSRTAEVAGRALYFDAWSNYYLGILRPEAGADEEFRKARAGFLRLIGVEKVEDVEPDMLASTGMARAALGAGLSAFGAKDEAAGRAWFDLLKKEGANPELRDLADYWVAWALLRLGKVDGLAAVADALDEGTSADASPGREALAALLVRAGYGPKANDALKPAAMIGLHALARMKRPERVRQLIEKYKIPTEGRDEIVFRWAAAQQALEAARKANDPKAFAAAAGRFEEALKAPDAAASPGLAASCRYLLGWSCYQAGDFAAAATAFSQAVGELGAARDPDAPDAAWMNAVALERIAARDRSKAPAAIQALKAFADAYPDHPKAALVELEVMKLGGESITVEQAESTALTDPAYAGICLGAIRNHAARWRKEAAAGRPEGEELANLRRALAAFRKLPESVREPSASLEAALAEADVALALDPGSAESREMLDRAGKIADALPPDDRLVGQYHAARFRRAQAANDEPALRAEAEWLARHSGGSPAEQAALIALARLADAALGEATDADRPTRLAAARDAYARLAEALGTTPEAIAASRNALVANARLAGHLESLGRHAEAAARYDAILGAYPKDANYLRRSGLAHFRAGEFAEALDPFETLLAGLEAGSDEWFEAKFYQVSCLARTEPDAAAKVYGQFRALYPELGGRAWRSKFEALGRGLPGR